MLKIKDEINLKELEKYGFTSTRHKKYIEEDIYENYTYWSKETEIILGTDYKVTLSIGLRSNNRKIDVGSINIKFDYELYKKFVEDTLYDLIVDGLVEKVDDK